MAHIGDARMDYILQRPSGYYFRLMVPSDLIESFGIKEIRRSLKTGSVTIAKERASLLSARIKRLIRKLRMKPLKREDIQSLVQSYVNEALEADEDYRLTVDPGGPHGFTEDGISDALFDARDMLLSNNYKNIEHIVDKKMLAPNHLDADKGSRVYKQLCRETTKGFVAILKEQLNRERGVYSNNPYSIQQDSEPAAPVEEVKPQGPSIGSLKDKWFNENIKADAWKPRTLKQYTGHFTILLQILGEDIPIDSIDHATVRHIKETLLELPSGMNKKAVFKDKAVPEILKTNKTEQVPTMSVSTINTYLVTLGAFFRWCVNNGYMAINYADGSKIKVSKQKRPDQIRQAFTAADLMVLFGSNAYRNDTFKDSYQFWLPVLGLYTGARINELCQLRLDDIQVLDGIPSIVLQEDAEDKGVSIKNMASMRVIPLHPFIVNDLNFMGHVQSMRDRGETRLFPELPYQNHNYGHKAVKWFGSYRKAQGIDSDQKTYHSFRHTLTDNLKQQLITETIIDELTGHAVKGETMGRYGKRYSVEILYNEAILKLDYKVNLEHLKGSKWTR